MNLEIIILQLVVNLNVLTTVGNAALGENEGGQENVAIGFNSLDANTSGANNVQVWVHNLGGNTTASDNTAVGRAALRLTTTGSNNSCWYGIFKSKYNRSI